MASREDLLQLVASLPEGAIDAAHRSLTGLQIWPPPPPPGREKALERFRLNQQRMEERMMAKMKPGECFVGGGSGSFSTGPGNRRRGRHGFGYQDGEDIVYETNIVHDESEFTVIERFRRDPAAREVSFVLEVTGPDGRTSRHEYRYALPTSQD